MNAVTWCEMKTIVPSANYDANGNPLNTLRKVKAYRFLSFYLTPDTQNYDAFFNEVVDPSG